MMKLLATERIDSSDDNTKVDCTIDASGTGFTVNYDVQSLVIDETNFKPAQMQFLMWGPTKMGLVDQDTYVDSRDWPAVMARMGFEKEIGALYCGDSTQEMALVISAPCKTETQCEVVAPAAPAQMIGAIYPKALELRRRNAAKIDLLSQVNPMDSLASLEKQVDLLTSLVIELATLTPGAADVALLTKTRDMLASSSSIASMTNEQAIDNITQFKKSLREAVAQYFAKRGV